MKFNFKLPNDVNLIIKTLEEAGYEAYAVGGCIRDAILGHSPADWDITTSAKPEVVKSLFRRTVDTGLQHGTITVMIGDEGYEVTTYRIDGDYTDHRRPDQVEYTGNLFEDLKRRDFTINAMAYNGRDAIVDNYHGVEDLEKGIIRCVGHANERFNEDALRMLRAIRFAARFGYEIDEETIEAIKINAASIKNVSAERIQVELTKTLISDNPDYIYKLHEYGLMQYILPEFEAMIGITQHNPFHTYTVDKHTLVALKAVENTRVLRWTMLCHDFGKSTSKEVTEDGIEHFPKHAKVSAEMARKVFDRLKFDNETKNRSLKLIEFHDYWVEATEKTVRRLMYKLGQEYFMDYIAIRRADILSQKTELIEKRMKNVDLMVRLYEKIMTEKQCITMKDLVITGKDLIEMGLKTGPDIGQVLTQLLEVVVENPGLNDKVVLKNMAEKLIGEIDENK